ncbi:hypothetical protein ACE7GA_05610 [Roseomonas sp. CCTCC AB2023176]|uniref:hypothetical protein n=1 Tax=Roseomonas sp. CCTCC AB2023176 TaxID=3342640 RepID=UPI0035DBC503
MADDDLQSPQGQRDFIRDAVRRLIEKHKAELGKEYARAERDGKVPRRSNQYGMDAERYGERLIDDGLRKGWL